MPESLGQAVLELGVDDSRLKAGLAGVEQQSKRTATAVQSIFQAAAIVGGAVAAARSFGGLIDAASELETITRKLSNTLGNQGAQQAIGDLRTLSDSLGLSFTVLADSFGSFTAAASAANIPLREQKDLFAAVSTSAQQLGLSNDAINGSLLALQQIAAKGVVQMEELRGQLGERLPTAFAATASGLGLTVQELIKLVESGRLTADQFFPALTKGLNELNGSGTGGVKTAEQNFASFGNELKTLQQELGKEFLPFVIAGVKQIGEAVKETRVQLRGLELKKAFGFSSQDVNQVVGQLDFIEKKFGLTREQSRRLVSDAISGIEKLRQSQGDNSRVNAFGGGLIDFKEGEFTQFLSLLEDRAKEFTAPSRAIAEAREKELAAGRAAAAEDAKRLNTLGKIEERLKALRAGSKGLDLGSSKLQENQREIARLEALTPKGANKLSAEQDVLRTARERLEIAQRSFGLEGRQLLQAKTALDLQKAKLDLDKAGARFQSLGGNAAVAAGDEAAINAKASFEAAGIDLRAQIVEGADALQRAAKEAQKNLEQAQEGFDRATRNLQQARDSVQRAEESRALATANSGLGSASAIAEDRQVLLADIAKNRASGRIDERKLAGQFGLGFNTNAGGFATGIDRLPIDQLAKIAQATSPLVDSQKAVIEAQKGVVDSQKALQDSVDALKEAQVQANDRESNLTVTVPIGGRESIYLP